MTREDSGRGPSQRQLIKTGSSGTEEIGFSLLFFFSKDPCDTFKGIIRHVMEEHAYVFKCRRPAPFYADIPTCFQKDHPQAGIDVNISDH